MSPRLFLFVLAVAGGGAGGVFGSAVGAMFGRAGLFAGGVAGGLLAAWIVAGLAVRFGWIPRERLVFVAAGTSIGFLAAAALAVSTLGSPVGPMLSTLLIGAGALVGARASDSRTPKS